VSCRRAAAALRAFATLAPRRAKKLGRWLKRVRRAAGPARDADVLLTRLQEELNPDNAFAQELVAVVVQSRNEAQEALVRIDDGSYGFCSESGEPIGVRRLLARPTATLTIEAQERRERMQRMFGD
jgi:RNA polymerase-binding transcription factor DksA